MLPLEMRSNLLYGWHLSWICTLLTHAVQVSIVALRNGEIRIVQSSMLGSILSNILLVLGCCFLAGGIHNTRTGTANGIEQDFNSTVASTMSSLMAVASASLIIPATVCLILNRYYCPSAYPDSALRSSLKFPRRYEAQHFDTVSRNRHHSPNFIRPLPGLPAPDPHQSLRCRASCCT